MEISRFPNKLKTYRHCTGFSQKKVARILGFADTSTLSRWEHGLNVPSIVQVFQLARIYHALPHELFDELWDQSDSEKNLLVLDGEPYNINTSFHL